MSPLISGLQQKHGRAPTAELTFHKVNKTLETSQCRISISCKGQPYGERVRSLAINSNKKKLLDWREARTAKKAPAQMLERKNIFCTDSSFYVAAAKWQSLETPNLCNVHSPRLSLQLRVKSTISRADCCPVPLKPMTGRWEKPVSSLGTACTLEPTVRSPRFGQTLVHYQCQMSF